MVIFPPYLKKIIFYIIGLSWILHIGTPIGVEADDEDIELKEAVIKGESDTVKYLLDRKADPNTRKDIEGFFKGWHVPLTPSTTPLMYAVEHNHFNIVQSLIEAKADPGLKTHGFFGKTALDMAKEKNHQEIQTYLENL